MSDTPRTDANEHLVKGPNAFSPYEHPVVDSEFARALERENTKMRDALIEISHMHDTHPLMDWKDLYLFSQLVAQDILRDPPWAN